MLITLAQMKTYLGISGTDKDDFLTLQIQIVSDAIQGYCGRIFEAANYIQTFYGDDFGPGRLKSLFLFHYPVNSIDLIEVDGEEIEDDWRIHKPSGLLTRRCGFFGYSGEAMEITYNAGFATLPPALASVVYSLVEERYNKSIAGVGLNFGSDVQRVSIPGTISVDFDYTLTNNDRVTAYGVILGSYVNILDSYRSERVIVGSGSVKYVEEAV